MSDPTAPKSEDTVAPPTAKQLVKEGPLPDVHKGIPSEEAQRDSPQLPQSTIKSIDDGIEDQQSRRSHRPKVVALAIGIVGVFAVNLTIIVVVMACGFWRALEPASVAKASAAEVVHQLTEIRALAASEALLAPGKVSDAKKKDADASPAQAPVRPNGESRPIRIEAKIYGEVRDSMVPLVALVSILTVAIVVILGTFLKAAFLANPNGHGATKEADPSPVPLLEALKGLVESIKALFKS
ncbi:hypothetical protein [Roseateles sp. MS654]|uniref:hypothetical protein n=1 Tax=Roseateles sp. MS654 TaxID=3412685 RepID=UPI003C2B4755